MISEDQLKFAELLRKYLGLRERALKGFYSP